MTFVSRLPDDRCPNENGMLMSSAMWNVRDVEPSVVQNPTSPAFDGAASTAGSAPNSTKRRRGPRCPTSSPVW